MHIVTLRDPSSPLEAQFVPDAGMIGISLTDSGTELLGQRRGLDAYVADGKTMGIPILYPWANRLGANTYTAEGTTVTLTPGRNGVRADPNGLPIHGVLAAYPRWRVTRRVGERADRRGGLRRRSGLAGQLSVSASAGADGPAFRAVLDGAHRGNPDR